VERDIVIDEVPALGERLARLLEDEARQAQSARGRFTLAVPGGTTAAQLFPRLADAAVDWTRTDFFWVDERVVPATHPQSNYGLAASLWLWPAGVPSARVHPMPTDDPDLARAARRYVLELERAAGTPPQLDVVILGMGPDGHVASLFPGHAALEADAAVVGVSDSPKPPPRRITLTLPALAAARRLVIPAFGASKADAVHEAVENPDSPLPVARTARRAQRVVFLLDPAAAGRLRQ
jgi:6-phosphogluconolactonase